MVYGWQAVSSQDHILQATDNIEVKGDPFLIPPTKANVLHIDEHLLYKETLMWQHRAMAAYEDPYEADLLHLGNSDIKTPAGIAFHREDLWKLR